MDIRWRAISVVLVIMATLAAVFLFVTIRQHQSEFDRIVSERQKSAAFLVDVLRQESFKGYEKRIHSLATSRRNVVHAFAARDRESLYEAARPILEILRKENPFFKTMFFVMPDDTVFLRVHMPEIHGDDVGTLSPLIRDVNETRRQMAGFEVVKLGIFYRIVRPVWHAGEYLGVVGFGIDANQLVDFIKHETGDFVFLAFHERDLAKTALMTEKRHQINDYIITANDSFLTKLPDTLTLAEERQNVTVADRNYVVMANQVLTNHKSEAVAKLVMMHDFTSEIGKLQRIIRFSIGLTAALLLLSFLVLYVSFGKLIQRIVDLNRTLEQANADLEIKVGQRTRKLEEEISERIRIQKRLQLSLKELGAANQDLKRKNAELDEFAYIASHDLQEPLRKLVSFSDLLRRDVGERLSVRAAKDLDFITDAAHRMQALVQDILNLSRSGRSAIHRERISMQMCIDPALAALELRIRETGAIIEQDPMPEIDGDPSMLSQVYQNLLSNALKFVDRQPPRLRLTVTVENGETVFGVKDNGIGIKAEYAGQIFSPFKRLHGRGEYEGTGIGLAICRKIIERHGGRIWVESEPDQGAHFKFTLANIGGTEDA